MFAGFGDDLPEGLGEQRFWTAEAEYRLTDASSVVPSHCSIIVGSSGLYLLLYILFILFSDVLIGH